MSAYEDALAVGDLSNVCAQHRAYTLGSGPHGDIHRI